MAKVKFKTKREIALENDIQSAIHRLLIVREIERNIAIENARLVSNKNAYMGTVWAIDEVLAELDFQGFHELKNTYRE